MPKQRRTTKQPFMSVVLNVLNGESAISAALTSLLKQTYPHNRYEIIVVNDGSTDSTADIVSHFKRVRLINLPHNIGIPAARNVGMKAAKGKILVGFDHDCIAEPTWLAQIAKGYVKDNPLGVGGRFVDSQPAVTLTDRYIRAGDSSVGARLAGPDAESKSPLRRLFRYIRNRVQEPDEPPKKKFAVTELYGANCSFPIEILKRVGGWDPSTAVRFYGGIEDRDLSQRIREAYPGRQFYVVPQAIVEHADSQTFYQYLRRQYRRGPLNLAFHRRYHVTPPIFPFPILYALLSIASAALYWPLAPLAVVLLPFGLYFWWPLKARRKRSPSMALFSYLQLLDETMVLVGLARGYVLLSRPRISAAVAGITGLLSLFAVLILTAGWARITLSSCPIWLHIAVSLPFLLCMPGLMAWRLLTPSKRNLSTASRRAYYIAGLSLLLLMGIGLAVNEAYVMLGMNHPLSTRPLTYAIGGSVAALAALAFLRSPRHFRLLRRPKHPLSAGRLLTVLPAVILGLGLPLLAAAGAITLNNGGSNALALVCLAGIALLALVMVWWTHELGGYYGWFLYSICLSTLLGTSLRGWNITGHDIMQEFQVFELTAAHAAWHMGYYQDAYTACLSITILPTIFQRLTGLADPFVFKFIFQIIAALIAPVMYETLQPYAGKLRALLAVLLFITFPTFFTDMMMLNRQEIALLFLAVSLLAGLDRRLGPRLKSLLGFLFLCGMVLSHYSTSYIALGALLVALLLAALWRWIPVLFRRTMVPYRHLTGVFHAPVIIAAVIVLIAWGTIATQTSDNIYKTLHAISASIGLQPKSAVKQLPPTPAPATVAEYAAAAVKSRSGPANAYYPASIVTRYPLEYSPEVLQPLNSGLIRMGVSVHALNTFYTAIRTVYALVIESLIVIGLLLALLLPKRNDRTPLQYLFFGVGMLIVIGVQVALPASAIDYGATRIIQEALLVLALPMTLAALWSLRLLKIPQRMSAGVLIVIMIGFYVVLSGMLPGITGGFKPALALSNSGFYYEAYYTHQEEIAAGHWLANNTPVGSHVYSDEFMSRKLITYAHIFPRHTLVPGAILSDSYVVLDYANSTMHQVPAYAGSNVLYYQPPIEFLTAAKDTVYSSTNTTIYK